MVPVRRVSLGRPNDSEAPAAHPPCYSRSTASRKASVPCASAHGRDSKSPGKSQSRLFKFHASAWVIVRLGWQAQKLPCCPRPDVWVVPFNQQLPSTEPFCRPSVHHAIQSKTRGAEASDRHGCSPAPVRHREDPHGSLPSAAAPHAASLPSVPDAPGPRNCERRRTSPAKR